MGALVPRKIRNLLVGAKNIGVTHVCSGAYRLHPAEWASGTAAGAIAAAALRRGESPREIHADPMAVARLQLDMVRGGAPVFWWTDVGLDHPAFEATQWLAAVGVIPPDPDRLEFEPDRPAEAARTDLWLRNAADWANRTEGGSHSVGEFAKRMEDADSASDEREPSRAEAAIRLHRVLLRALRLDGIS
jgi:hypothetical protein